MRKTTEGKGSDCPACNAGVRRIPARTRLPNSTGQTKGVPMTPMTETATDKMFKRISSYLLERIGHNIPTAKWTIPTNSILECLYLGKCTKPGCGTIFMTKKSLGIVSGTDELHYQLVAIAGSELKTIDVFNISLKHHKDTNSEIESTIIDKINSNRKLLLEIGQEAFCPALRNLG